MYPNTEIKTIDEENSRQPLVILAVLGVAVAGCLIAFIVLFLFSPARQALVEKYFPSPTVTPTSTPVYTPTHTPTPTLTSTPTHTPTPTPNMTAQAYEATAVSAADKWRKFLVETFETSDRWHTGTEDDEFAKIKYEVKDGKYIWDVTSHQEFVQRMRVNTASVGDFYFSLEARQPGFTTAADYGIIFREDTSNNYYYFSVNNKGRYDLWLHYHDEWKELIPETISSAILPREMNKLALIAEGDHFIFFINDQYVADIHDQTLAKGRVGMGIEIMDPDLNIVFEFDNVILKYPR